MPKYDLGFNPPLMNSAGSLGFAPDRKAGIDWARFGAFVTNPLSPAPRSPAQGRRFATYAGGFLMHTGYPNPGLRAAIRRYAAAWARSPVPVLVHVLGQNPLEITTCISKLEGLEGVVGIELGLPPGIEAAAAQEMITAAVGELPLIVRLPLDQALELAPATIASGATAVSLGAPRGALPAAASNDQGQQLIEGRLYGPAVFPLALQVVNMLAQQHITVIGSGGVYIEAQVQAMIAAGAAAVQIDAALWKFSDWPGLAPQD